MAQIIGKVDAVTSPFTGQGDILVFDSITDANYAAATLASLINGSSLGDIFEGSTAWTGDDVSFENINNEQGISVTTKTVMGSYGFEFSHLSVTSARLLKFMAGTVLTNPATLPTWLNASPVPVLTGFGHVVGVITCPIALLNETKDKMLIFPKAKIATSIVFDGTNQMLKSVVTAEKVDTANLKTCILVTGLAVYATA